MNRDFWLINIWKEGKYADLWSLNHFLGGVILAQIMLYFNFSFWAGLILAVFLMATWETYELFVGIEETICNKSTDIGFGVLGFLLHVFFLIKLGFVVFISVLIAFAFLELWGYLAYRLRIKRDRPRGIEINPQNR